MPRELVCLQVGQCGNQVGCKFWDLALQEHLQYDAEGRRRAPPKDGKATVCLDDAMSSFFYNKQSRKSSGDVIDLADVKARAVPIDMEEGVLDGLLKGNLRSLFDRRQCIANSSGSGNNWAVGHVEYGSTCLDEVFEKIRCLAEDCDSLQTFLLLHSLGGGTGSGFGTRILAELEDEYPSIYRFVSAVFPQENDDVVTSPYNSMLSLAKLTDHADCVIPVDNQQLAQIAAASSSPQRGKKPDDLRYSIAQPHTRMGGGGGGGGYDGGSGGSVVQQGGKKKGGTAFDQMNSIVASMLTHLTASMRFPGTLNVDLNEITTNLVPYPRLHFLHSAVAPTFVSRTGATGTRMVSDLFKQSFDRRNQLLTAPLFKPTYFACCVMMRGEVSISDATGNIDSLRSSISLADWNQEGFKVGMCSVPACEQPASLLSLTNNSGITQSLKNIEDSFLRLYSVGAHLHHYTDILEKEEIDDAHATVRSLISDYEAAARITLPHDAESLRSADQLLF